MLHRSSNGGIEVLLGHMGGPYWSGKDEGAWSIPKGEYDPDENPFDVARREFAEEIGMPVPATKFVDLGEVRQSAGKVVRAWAAEGDLDATRQSSNTFELEWPPRSGRVRQFPEIDRAAWFDLRSAHDKLVTGQRPLLDRLRQVGSGSG